MLQSWHCGCRVAVAARSTFRRRRRRSRCRRRLCFFFLLLLVPVGVLVVLFVVDTVCKPMKIMKEVVCANFQTAPNRRCLRDC